MLKEIKVLYVDDEIHNLNAFRASFRKEFQIYTALSAKEGFQLIRKYDIPIILADHRMPEITGVDFLTSVKEQFPKSVRILLTGYTDIISIIEAINKGGISFYISKPWSSEEIISCIKIGYSMFSDQQFKELKIEALNSKVKELNSKLNYEYEHYSILMNENLSTAIKQYLSFFKDYVKHSKKQQIHFEVRSSNSGIEIELSKNDNRDKIREYLNEYMSFLLYKDGTVNPIMLESNINEKEILVLRLEEEIRHLKHSLEIEKVRTTLLTDTVDRFNNLLDNLTSKSVHYQIPSSAEDFNVRTFHASMQTPNIASLVNENKNLMNIIKEKHILVKGLSFLLSLLIIVLVLQFNS